MLFIISLYLVFMLGDYTQFKEEGVQFIPENWSKTYFDWMDNIQDWCISRQLWWGHRIPAWYDEEKNIFVGKNEAEVRKKYQLEKMKN